MLLAGGPSSHLSFVALLPSSRCPPKFLWPIRIHSNPVKSERIGNTQISSLAPLFFMSISRLLPIPLLLFCQKSKAKMDPSNDQLSQEEENTTNCSQNNNKRRLRTNFSDAQTAILEQEFMKSWYPDQQIKKGIARQLGISSDRVTIWFQNRRSKWRRSQHQHSIIPQSRNCQAKSLLDLPSSNVGPQQNFQQISSTKNCWTNEFGQATSAMESDSWPTPFLEGNHHQQQQKAQKWVEYWDGNANNNGYF